MNLPHPTTGGASPTTSGPVSNAGIQGGSQDLATGTPRFADAALAELARREGPAAAWREALARYGEYAPQHVSGDFAIGANMPDGSVYLAVDRFAVRSLCYRILAGRCLFAERATDISGAGAAIDPQSIFDYLYFHVIPSPRTIYSEVFRLPPGHCATFRDGKITIQPYWQPVMTEPRKADFAALSEEFRGLLRDSVASQLGSPKTGCFLSGGTDSSTVTGMLGQVTGAPAQCFSIGFEAEGYDEMEYSRLAARHFGAKHHEYYVTPADLVASIPEVARSYDQPFGNSSVLPSYYCSRLARDNGMEKILGGDGGDELFGGNTRYAKQRVFGVYDQLPAMLRKSVLEPLLAGDSLAARLPLVRKAASYVTQARVPMPDRTQTYNLLMRLGTHAVLTEAMMTQADPEAPLRHQRSVYSECPAGSLVNRMLAFDWRYTLAETDIPKVVGATALAGLQVGFPMLDDRLVDFSMRLPAHYKVNRLKLRWFFKEALRGFLPDAIITKKKQGFGLPFGVWTVRDEGLQKLAADSMHSLVERGILRREFVESVLKVQLPAYPGYYGEIVWITMMLEQWLRGHAPDYHL